MDLLERASLQSRALLDAEQEAEYAERIWELYRKRNPEKDVWIAMQRATRTKSEKYYAPLTRSGWRGAHREDAPLERRLR